MKNKVLIFGALVAVIIVIGIVWYLYFYQSQQQSERGTCQDLCGDGICQEIVCEAIGCPCTETSTSCPQDCTVEETAGGQQTETKEEKTIDETINWKTYKGEAYSFEVKYPDDWYYHISNFTEVNRQMICFNPKDKTEDECIIVLMIDKDDSLGEWYISTKNMLKESNNITESTTTVDGIKTKVITTDAKVGLSKTLFLEKDDNVYNFSMEAGQESVFEKILSTFNFLE